MPGRLQERIKPLFLGDFGPFQAKNVGKCVETCGKQLKREKNQKKMKKGVDIWGLVWYYSQALRRAGH